jgi:hypothetical protein
VETALDFLHLELSASDELMLPVVQKGLAQRTFTALGHDEAATAKRLGLTKPALKKLLS